MTWPVVSLGEVMSLDPDPHSVEFVESYRNIGILNFGRGAFKKPDIRGEATSASTLFRVRADQFIYSRLFAFEGAYTVVPKEFDGAFVSNEFPTFTLRTERIDSGYLQWVFRRPETWRALASKSVGLGDRRQRIHPTHVLSFEIPLPPLDQQQAVVERMNRTAQAVAGHLEQAKRIECEIAAAESSAFALIAANAPRLPLREIAPLTRRPVVVDPETSYTEIGVRSFFKGLFTRRSVKGEAFEWQKLFHVREGDLVFSNLMAWEQAIGLAKAEHNNSVGNHRMLTCEVDRRRATPEFLFYYFTTDEGFRKIVEASPGTMVRNKTLSTKLLPNITVPTPSLDAQVWFTDIQRKANEARLAQSEAVEQLRGLVPATLHEALG